MAGLPSIVLLAADAISVVNQFIGQPDWGVFLNGQQVIGQGISDIISTITGQGLANTMDVEFEARWSITNAPQEGGAFMSYNRVQTPYRVVMTVSAGGTAQNRSTLLQQVQAIVNTVNLYTVLMPEGPIEGLNPVGYAFRRRADDVGILTISVLFAQVRPAGDPTFNTMSVPGSATGTATATGGASGTANIQNPQPAFAGATSQQSFAMQSPTTPSPSFLSSVNPPST